MLAQLVEQRTFNPFVVGSIPAHPTNKTLAGYREFAIHKIANSFFIMSGDSLVTVSRLMTTSILGCRLFPTTKQPRRHRVLISPQAHLLSLAFTA